MTDPRPHVYLRIMSPLGRYPDRRLSVGGGRLLHKDDLVVSAIQVQPEWAHGVEEDFYSEIEVLALEEVRFLASISLALHPDHGMVYTYPLASELEVDRDLEDEEALLDLAENHALEMARNRFWSRSAVMPPLAGGPTYEWCSERFDEARLAELVGKISLRDHLLIRGLGALLRAQMLAQHHEFGEAAPTMLYIALEAAFQLVLRILRNQGLQNPSAHDAGAFVDQAFNPGTNNGRFFAGYYDDRIKVMHPSSRFGVFAIAPVNGDDYFFLRDALVELYGFLITQRVWSVP
jgi:hypothetical protein